MEEDIVKQRQTVNPMPILSDDVLIEILLKLPLRTLLSFKSVSKHWLSLIKNPNFVTLLTKRPIDVRINPMLILRNVRNSKKAATKRTKTVLTTLLSYDDDDETLRYEDDLDLDHVFPKRHGVDVRLLGPCNGLFCIIDTFDVVVLNPTTRRCRKLPQSRLVSHDRSCVGFGFDPVCNDHKVFWFKKVAYKDYYDDDYDDDYDDYDYEIRGYKVDVFSLSTKRWRKIEDVVPACNTFRLDSHSLFVNGAFHWLERYNSSIIVFDITEESFELFDMPTTFRVGGDGDELTLSVLNESLALICQKLDTDAFEICVMEEYGRDTSWMKLYSFSCGVAIEKPLSFGQEEEFLLQKIDGKLVSFNLNKRVIKDFQVRGVLGEMYAFRYKESLVSLKRCKRKE